MPLPLLTRTQLPSSRYLIAIAFPQLTMHRLLLIKDIIDSGRVPANFDTIACFSHRISIEGIEKNRLSSSRHNKLICLGESLIGFNHQITLVPFSLDFVKGGPLYIIPSLKGIFAEEICDFFVKHWRDLLYQDIPRAKFNHNA